MPRLSRRALLAGAAALAACRPEPSPMTAARADAAPGNFVVVDGVPIHFARAGSGHPLCLIHGASGNLNDMTFRLAPALAERYDVIAVDRPGHGRSGLPPGGGVSINRQAALIRGALAALGVARTIVVGHSYGGSVALAWAVDAPETVSALTLVSAPSQVWEGGLGLTNDLLASAVTGPLLAHAIPPFVGAGMADRALATVFAPQAAPPGYLDHLDLGLVLQPASLRENARQLVALKEELRPMVPAYARLDMPVEILHGEADRTVGLDIHAVPLARQIPGARLTRLPGIGHMPHQVATDRVVAGIDAAASRIGAPG
ncbi:MAG: alpha/beta hydrolase [Rhodovulum sulfidophilum]|uniref:Alpha/beta hydrolase n=1 Tax=Rhodovulum sulfidophilum TaxID=35806 RepID=A0A2W5N4D9_RHOSU|nr:MAG: alpha/beta hydrolase [Rhodovulum sulfidophilum]